MKNNLLSKIAKQLGNIGGKKSVESRFKGKSKAEISKMMSDVRRNRLIDRTAQLLGEVMREEKISEMMRDVRHRNIAKGLGDAIREDGDPYSPYGDGWD